MDLLVNIAVGLGCTFIGWLLAEPYRIPSWLAIRQHDNWQGIWFCRWRPKRPDDDSWVTEKVVLTHFLGKLKIDLYEPGDEYLWEAVVTLRKGIYLVGVWRSKKPHATSAGAVHLKISNQGCSLLGYFTGPHVNEKMTIYPFILAQTEVELERVTKDFKKLL